MSIFDNFDNSMTLNDRMPLGKFKGIRIREIIDDQECEYISWAVREGLIKINSEVRRYLGMHCKCGRCENLF